MSSDPKVKEEISPSAPLNLQNDNTNQMPDQVIKISATYNQNIAMVNTTPLENLQLNSEVITCPKCGYVGNSIVITQCSCANCCCCCWGGLVIWICFQLCRNKALSCKDADHTCPKCGTFLAHYQAC